MNIQILIALCGYVKRFQSISFIFMSFAFYFRNYLFTTWQTLLVYWANIYTALIVVIAIIHPPAHCTAEHAAYVLLQPDDNKYSSDCALHIYNWSADRALTVNVQIFYIYISFFSLIRRHFCYFSTLGAFFIGKNMVC